MELLNTLPCRLKQAKEFLLAQDTKLGVATPDAQLIILVMLLIPPMIDMKSLAESFSLLLKGSVFSPEHLLIHIHLEVLMDLSEATRCRLKFQIGHLQVFAVSPHSIKARLPQPGLGLTEVVFRFILPYPLMIEILVQEFPPAFRIERCV